MARELGRGAGRARGRNSVVLAPDLENTCTLTYSAESNVVSLRGGLLLRVLPALQGHAPDRIEIPRGRWTGAASSTARSRGRGRGSLGATTPITCWCERAPPSPRDPLNEDLSRLPPAFNQSADGGF